MLNETILPTARPDSSGNPASDRQLSQIEQQALDQIQQHFLDSPYSPLRKLDLQLINTTLVIRGSVSTFFLRQVALALAQRMNGVDRIIDHITVCAPLKDETSSR